MSAGPHPRCIGCGRPLEAGRVTCAECFLGVRGSDCEEEVVVSVDPKAPPTWRAPEVCCCCLAPREVLETRWPNLLTTRLGFSRKVPLEVRVPWCRPCRRQEMRNKVLGVVMGLVALVVALPAGAGCVYLVMRFLTTEDDDITGLGLLLCFVPGVVLGVRRKLNGLDGG